MFPRRSQFFLSIQAPGRATPHKFGLGMHQNHNLHFYRLNKQQESGNQPQINHINYPHLNDVLTAQSDVTPLGTIKHKLLNIRLSGGGLIWQCPINTVTKSSKGNKRPYWFNMFWDRTTSDNFTYVFCNIRHKKIVFSFTFFNDPVF